MSHQPTPDSGIVGYSLLSSEELNAYVTSLPQSTLASLLLWVIPRCGHLRAIAELRSGEDQCSIRLETWDQDSGWCQLSIPPPCSENGPGEKQSSTTSVEQDSIVTESLSRNPSGSFLSDQTLEQLYAAWMNSMERYCEIPLVYLSTSKPEEATSPAPVSPGLLQKLSAFLSSIQAFVITGRPTKKPK